MICFPIDRRSFVRAVFAVPLSLLAASLRFRSIRAEDATPVGPATSASPAETPSELMNLLTSCDSVFGVMLIDARDQVVFERNADVPFVSASLYKLVLIAETLKRIEDGELRLDQTVEIHPEYFDDGNGEDSYFSPSAIGYEATVEELIYSSGSYSSNVGAQGLLSLTSIERLDNFAIQLGLFATRYWVLSDEVTTFYPGDDGTAGYEELNRATAFVGSFAGSAHVNVTTPRDMATFFRMVRDELLISPLSSWRMKSVLVPKVINDRIPALLPDDVVVIHKTGNLEGVLHDAGIIETPNGSAIVIAMAQAFTNLDQTFVVEQRLGLVAYEQIMNDAGDDQPGATPQA